MRAMVHLMLGLAAALAAVALLVILLGRATWSLSGAGEADLEEVAQLRAPDRHPTAAVRVHRVSEWPADRERAFGEAPMLAAQVRAGTLPPVARRLPEEPLVVHPPDVSGKDLYGGAWRRLATGPGDIGIIRFKIAYDGLVRWGPMGRQILPNLAVRWDIDDDGRTYTFRLRKGVRWSDGHPFTADDILFCYEDVLKNPELTPVIPRELRTGGALVEVAKLGPHRVRFRFKEPNGLFLQALASTLDWIVNDYPAHYLRRFHPRHVDRRRLQEQARGEGFDFWYQLFQHQRDWSCLATPRLTPWVVSRPPPARPIVLRRNPTTGRSTRGAISFPTSTPSSSRSSTSRRST